MSAILMALLMMPGGTMPKVTVEAMVAEARGRNATIDSLLGAMARRDQKGFAAVGGPGIAFSTDAEMVLTAVMAPRTPRLGIESLAALRACKAGRPQSTQSDWYSVSWDCPANARVEDTRYLFKFAGRNLVAVQAGRRPPRVKIN